LFPLHVGCVAMLTDETAREKLKMVSSNKHIGRKTVSSIQEFQQLMLIALVEICYDLKALKKEITFSNFPQFSVALMAVICKRMLQFSR
jgi:hypothetical protein